MNLVVNEWLLDFSIDSESSGNIGQVKSFLDVFLASDSMLVIGLNTPFARKFNRYAKRFSYDLEITNRFNALHRLLFRDLARTTIIERPNPVPVEARPGVKDDDWYLLELAATVENGIIITTDEPLISAVRSANHFRIAHLSDYVSRKGAI